MNLKALLKPFLLYTCLLGFLTAGAIHLATNSGFFLVFSAAGGLLLVVLNVGAAGTTSLGSVEQVETEEEGREDARFWPRTDSDTSLTVVLLLYGVGVLLWSLVLLYVFYVLLA